ncbi:hypothetical protein [Breznakiella homolactica]|uniref:Uncharacterized protein n=1 Tax=Breznakiella homolactica TaxID=2798577 RepID=A0A7T7XMY7_9SPIR|nr:hypothetical protein [Breznakiella homolactica]QQO09202.1 hypothetical protein JFL75_20100 [Breznakiella homolactica]
MKKTWTIIGILLVCAQFVWGATYTWTGSIDSDWAEPGNWDLDDGTVPGVGDDAVIPAGAFTVNLSAVASADSVSIGTGSTLDLRGYGITLGSLTNSGTLRLQGGETLTGVTASGGTVVLYNGGTGFPALTSFANLTISGGIRPLGGPITVTGTLSVSAGAALNLNGSSVASVTTVSNLGTVQFTGTETLGTITSLGGTAVFSGTAVTNLAGIRTFSNLTINTGGTHTAPGALSVTGTLSMAAGTLVLPSGGSVAGTSLTGGTVEFSGTAATNLAGISTFANLTISSTAIHTAAGSLTVTGTLSMTAGTLVLPSGGSVFGASLTGGTVNFSGTNTGLAGITAFNNLTFSAGTSTANNGISVAGDLVISGTGTVLSMAGNNITLTGSFTNAGTLRLNGGETLTPLTSFNGAGGTVQFTATNTGLAGLTAFNNLTISGGTSTLGAAIAVTGTLAISAGAALDVVSIAAPVAGPPAAFNNNGELRITDDPVVGTALNHTAGTGSVVFSGTGTTLAGITVFNDAELRSGSRTLPASTSIGRDLIVSGGSHSSPAGSSITAAAVSITGGSFTPDSNTTINANVNGSSSGNLIITGTNTLTVNGNWDVANFTANTSTVAFTGSGTIRMYTGYNFYNLTINGSANYSILSGGTAYTVGNNLTVNGALTLNSSLQLSVGSDFTVASGASLTTGNAAQFTIGRNWTVDSSANFTANTATVLFNGTAGTITTGGKAFGSLTMSASGIYSIAGGLSVNYDYTQTSGTVNVQNSVILNTVSVGRNFIQSGGTFSPVSDLAFTIAASGYINQTAGTLNSATSLVTINAANGINLSGTNGIRNIHLFNSTAGGLVYKKTLGNPLAVTAQNNAANQAVTIENNVATDVTIGIAGIQSSGGAVSVSSSSSVYIGTSGNTTAITSAGGNITITGGVGVDTHGTSTVDATGGTGTITFNATSATTLNDNTTIKSGNGAINLNVTNGPFTSSGTTTVIQAQNGTVTIDADTTITLNNNTGITTTGGSVNLEANSGTITLNNNTGITTTGGSVTLETNSGTITLNNTAAIQTGSGGITVNSGANITANTSSSMVTTTGTISLTAAAAGSNINLAGNSYLRSTAASGAGNITLNASNEINISGSAQDISTGGGTIEFTAGYIIDLNGRSFLSGAGNITMNGDYGIDLNSGSNTIKSTGGTVTLTGGIIASAVSAADNAVETTNNSITVIADQMNFAGGGFGINFSAGTGTGSKILLKNRTANAAISIGGTGDISNDELQRMNAVVVDVGSKTTGTYQVTGTITVNSSLSTNTAIKTLVLRTGAGVTGADNIGGVGSADVNNLAVQAASGVTLSLQSSISNLAIESDDDISVAKGGGGFTISSIEGVNGITTTASDKTITLSAQGVVIQPDAAAVISAPGTAGTLSLGGTGAEYTLTNTSNAAGILVTGTVDPKSIEYVNSTAFTAGTAATGVSADGGPVSLRAGSSGTLTVTLANNISAINVSSGDAVVFQSPAALSTVPAGITVSSGTGAGNIVFQRTLTGAQNLTVTAGTGTVTFTGAVSSVGTGTGAAIAVTGTTGTTTFGSTLGTSSGITVSGNTVFNNTVTIGAGDTSTVLSGSVTINVPSGTSAITSGRNIQFGTTTADTVALAGAGTGTGIETNANNGNIVFNGAVTGSKNFSVTTHGTGTVTFNGNVTTGYSPKTGYALSVDTERLILGSNVSLDTSAVSGDILLRVDGLDLSTNNNTVLAGPSQNTGGDVQLVPHTNTQTIEFSPSDTSIADVWYNSGWSRIYAGSFTIGHTSHQADITVRDIGSGTAIEYELTVINSGTAAIYIKESYVSANKRLILNSGSGGVVLDGNGSTAAVNIGTAAFTVSGPFTLNDLTTGTITATGGITIGSSGISASGSGSHDLILDAGSADITISGNVGSGTALGAITVSSARGVSFTGTVNAASFTQTTAAGTVASQITTFSGSQTYSGAFNFTGQNLNINGALDAGGKITVTNTGTFTKGTTGVVSSDGGFEQNGAGPSSVGQSITTTSGTAISFATGVTITTANNGTVTFNSSGGGGPIILSAAVSSTNTNRSLILNSGAGAVTVSGTVSLSGSLTVTLTTGGSFTSASTITASRGFTQSGADGVSTIGGNITASNYAISFAGEVTISNNVTLNSGTGAGAVTLSKAVSGTGRALTVSAGTGTASLAGIGTNAAKLSSLTVTGSIITLNGEIHTSGAVALTGTASGTAVNANESIYSDTTITVTNANGNLALAVGKAIQAQGRFSVSGGTVNNGTITAGPSVTFNPAGSDPAASNCAVYFGGAYSGSGTLAGNTANTLIGFGGLSAALGTYTHNNGWLVFLGSVNQTFNPGSNEIYNVLVSHTGGTSVSLTGNSVAQRGNFLIIRQGGLNLGSLGWLMDSSGTYTSGFRGVLNTLVMQNDGSISGGNFITESTFTVTATGTPTVTASGNITIDDSTTGALDAVTFVMNGSGTLYVVREIGSLTVNGSGSATLGFDLTVKNNVAVNAGATLDVDNTSNYPITLGGNWDQTGGTFQARQGTVTFTGLAVEIRGSTTWYDFVAERNGATIRFANNPASHSVAHSFRVVSSSSAQPILLTKLTANGDPSTPRPSLPGEAYLFWDLNLSSSAYAELSNVRVTYSHAIGRTIPVRSGVDAIPYYDPGYPANSHFNLRWIDGILFTYSFTEDTTGNGRIDRIRVQASTEVGNNFSGFTAEVDGYTVKGYQRHTTDYHIIYILLEEKGYPDGDATPEWRIVSNTTLTDYNPGTTLLKTYDEASMIPADTVWPRISYSLMLPDESHREVFVQMTEPVSGLTGAADFNITGVTPSVISMTPVSSESGRIREFILRLDQGLSPHVLSVGTGGFQLNAPGLVYDRRGEFAFIDLDYDPPEFPVDETYGTYISNGTNYLDKAVPVSAAAHRITDVLVSIPPSSSSDTRYFVWPVWARDQSSYLVGGGDEVGTIRDFNGTKRLRYTDITLEAKVNSDIYSAAMIPSAVLGSGISSSYRASERNGSEDLWLPEGLNLVPKAAPVTGPVTGTSVGSGLFDFALLKSNYADQASLEFFFKLTGSPSDLSIGYLDMPAGGAIPSNWYRKVKPFGFDVKDITEQRSGVTILNNVIDPTKGEKTYLNTTLTKSGRVTIQVFTMDGTLVQILHRGSRSAGTYIDSWDGRNRGGRAVARGMYFIRVVGPDIDEIRKVMVVKE